MKIFFYASGTEAPSAEKPNGVISMDFTGVNSTNQPTVRGLLNATGSGIRFSETGNFGQGQQSTRLNVTQSGDNGSGIVLLPDDSGDNQTILFGYKVVIFVKIR